MCNATIQGDRIIFVDEFDIEEELANEFVVAELEIEEWDERTIEEWDAKLDALHYMNETYED